MMDYYEELGIERSASVAEIRQAYRRLMQLLHPDHCADEAARRLAELQARRLNAVLEVLSDPARREHYDRQLSFVGPSLIGPPPHRPPRAPAWLWPVAGVAVIVALMSLVPGARRPVTVVETSPPAPPSAVAIAKSAASSAPALQPPLPPSRNIHRPARIPMAIETQSSQAVGSIPSITPPNIALESPLRSVLAGDSWDPPPISAPSREPPHLPPQSNLAGEWLFVPEPRIHNNGLYPPEYIELRVTERAGLVRGKYRARYHIADRAISPNVTFEFQGRAEGTPARLPWAGPGGSRGEVTLRLLATGALEVKWAVSQLGSELGLISGTATLVRKIE